MLRKQSQNGVRADGDEERGRHGLGPQRRGADSASGPQSVGFAKVYPLKCAQDSQRAVAQLKFSMPQ